MNSWLISAIFWRLKIFWPRAQIFNRNFSPIKSVHYEEVSSGVWCGQAFYFCLRGTTVKINHHFRFLQFCMRFSFAISFPPPITQKAKAKRLISILNQISLLKLFTCNNGVAREVKRENIRNSELVKSFWNSLRSLGWNRSLLYRMFQNLTYPFPIWPCSLAINFHSSG